MKPSRTIFLVASHAAFVGLGWLLGKPVAQTTATADAGFSPAIPPQAAPPRAAPSEPNPIFRANGADFRATWNEMIRRARDRNGEPHRNSINLFIDWCGVDPEGAVLGLSELYAPRFGHNYLNNAVGTCGVELAPALVKHWRKLRLQQEYKVENVMGRALRELAREDSAGAVGLVLGLPPGKRAEIYDNLFEDVETETKEQLAAGILASATLADWERERLWRNFASELDCSDPEDGVWRWIRKTDDLVGLKSLAVQGAINASRRDDWSAFLDAMVRVDAAQQSALRDHVIAHLKTSGDVQKRLDRLADECAQRGLIEWTQAIAAAATQ